MLPSRPVDWVTRTPVRERVLYPTSRGPVEGELTRPSLPGPHPGVVLCLGVVPFDEDHPQVPRLQEALARAGFASLLYWSPAMRDFRLDPADISDLAMAYEWLIGQPGIDPDRSGLIGTCVGGSFALLAAAELSIRDQVGFVFAFAPYASMRSLARDIATATLPRHGIRKPWAVDQLTRKVYLHSLTEMLEPDERDRLRETLAERDGQVDLEGLSELGRTIAPLLTAITSEEVEAALGRLPLEIRERLDAMSPLDHLREITTPLLVLVHDRDDHVIPFGESELLWAALAGRPGVRCTELTMFRHLDPTKVKLGLVPLARELARFAATLYPIFRRTAG
jgi:dienelactone hydrolase